MFYIVAAHLGQMTRKHKSPPLSLMGLLKPTKSKQNNNTSASPRKAQCKQQVTLGVYPDLQRPSNIERFTVKAARTFQLNHKCFCR